MFAERIKPYRTALLFLTAMVVLVVGYTYRLDSRKSIPAELEGVMRPDARALESLALKDQNNQAFHREDFTGKWSFVFFGYTYCPDVCPLTLSNLARTFGEMGDAADQFQVLLITVDPARDTPLRLAEYLANFNDGFLGLTGSEDEIRAVANEFGAFFARAGEGEDYTVDHTARVFVLSPSGKIPLTFPVTATSQEMIRDLALLLEAAS